MKIPAPDANPADPALRVIVLGSAAGGGFPQWNANSDACRRARAGDTAAMPRTQASIAVSADGRRWAILNASPDIRTQIEATQPLQPDTGLRSSPIEAVVLTGGDVDTIAGLLTLRERQAFSLYAPNAVHEVLDRNPIFNVLHPDHVTRRLLTPEFTHSLQDATGEPIGVEIEAFAVPGKIPLFLEPADGMPPPLQEEGSTFGLRVALPGSDSGFFYVPSCAGITPRLASRMVDADLVFFDATLWSDDEMVATGAGGKTGQRMGHMSVAGLDGTMAAFRALNVKRKIMIHINNTNPVLLDDSPERAIARDAGWEVAYDGMELTLCSRQPISNLSCAV